MRVEFTVPMEGPRTEKHPKGLSRRPGSQEDVDDAEGQRLVERGMAFEVDDLGQAIRVVHVSKPPIAASSAADLPPPGLAAPAGAPQEQGEAAPPPPPPPAAETPPSTAKRQAPTEKAVK